MNVNDVNLISPKIFFELYREIAPKSIQTLSSTEVALLAITLNEKTVYIPKDKFIRYVNKHNICLNNGFASLTADICAFKDEASANLRSRLKEKLKQYDCQGIANANNFAKEHEFAVHFRPSSEYLFIRDSNGYTHSVAFRVLSDGRIAEYEDRGENIKCNAKPDAIHNTFEDLLKAFKDKVQNLAKSKSQEKFRSQLMKQLEKYNCHGIVNAINFAKEHEFAVHFTPSSEYLFINDSNGHTHSVAFRVLSDGRIAEYEDRGENIKRDAKPHAIHETFEEFLVVFKNRLNIRNQAMKESTHCLIS